MKTSDFDFYVPPELIAHQPAIKRDHSRLLVLHRKSGTIEHKHFYDILDYLDPGDLLVLNDTKVIPGNLTGQKEGGGGKVQILLVKKLKKRGGEVWECLVKPGKRLQVGSRVSFGGGVVLGTVLEKTESGEQTIEFQGDLPRFIREEGEIPLPPYIKNEDQRQQQLGHRYQTVYADKDGASAAPTAGLHFTPELLKKATGKGVEIAQITLHTGLATFKPVYAEAVEEHQMYFEEYEVPVETIAKLKAAKRVVAVGTTSVRTLESIAGSPDYLKGEGLKGETDLFIYPGYKFKIVDAMITNFHWPRTSLIMLVSAFASRELILKAYQEAIAQKYRFFSFGDAMVVF
jgi:S-adenosylmethionine:tRNA ribosyltransferase-isomerase